jgi:NAD(P)-dependent dehydrogenase (short-subunit alcohol dehydrogenase family)
MEEGSLVVSEAPGMTKPFRLDGKVALITGAASGIGNAIAKQFAASGATVRILDLDDRAASEAAQRIIDWGGSATSHQCDVTDQKQVQDVFQTVVAQGPLNILVNNAGVSHIGTVESTTEADFDRVYRVNVKGVYNCTQATIKFMKETGGVILNMASIAGSAALADRFAYSTSKGAVIAMTFSVAKDYLKHGIRCNCISPARVHTPFVDGYLKQYYPGREAEMFGKLSASQPIGRMGKAEEVAYLALFLCSDQASFLTGVDYPLDGGFFNLRG